MVVLTPALIAGIAVAAVVTDRATAYLSTTSPLRARNYRGIEVPICGMAVMVGALAGLAAIAVVDVPSGPSQTSRSSALIASLMLGFGLLGLWDDVAAGTHGRGWRTHLRALRHGQATTGAVKLVGGTAFAFVVSTGANAGLWRTLLYAAVIAMSANLVNLLDLRPGRAGKFSLLLLSPFVIILCVQADRVWVPLLAIATSIAAFLRFDLRERAMLGDAGANAIGAVLGFAIVRIRTTSLWTTLGIALVLAALHVAGDRPGLSRLIAATPPLRTFDQAGRVAEADQPPRTED